ncbi:MAG: hypothetical protein V1790_17640 [Planctomycetota bacterium]
MNLPIRTTAIELQHLEQVLASAGWALIVRKLESLELRAADEEHKAPNWDVVREARGKRDGLRLALQAPRILIEEIAEQLKEGGK